MTILLKNGLVLGDFAPATASEAASLPAIADVLIEGSRIDAVGPSLAAPPGAEVVNLEGHLVIPGLLSEAPIDRFATQEPLPRMDVRVHHAHGSEARS